MYTFGIDVGSSIIKAVLLDYNGEQVVIDQQTEKIRKRNPETVADQLIDYVLEKNNLTYKDIGSPITRLKTIGLVFGAILMRGIGASGWLHT